MNKFSKALAVAGILAIGLASGHCEDTTVTTLVTSATGYWTAVSGLIVTVIGATIGFRMVRKIR